MEKKETYIIRLCENLRFYDKITFVKERGNQPMKMKKRFLSLLLTLALVLGLLPGMVTTARAEEVVSYVTCRWNGSEVTKEEKELTSYTFVESGTTTWEDGCWYAVRGTLTISSRIKVTGTVNLILCDGAKLNASKGITVQSRSTLNIYA